MTKLYFVFNFELTTIFAGYAMFSSMIWINTLVILPKQRVEVKDKGITDGVVFVGRA